MSARTKDSRWNLRVKADDDIVVRRAAAESERELSEFVRTAAVNEAERVLADRTVFELDAAQVQPEEATARARKGQPQRRPIPAVLLARLAVDRVHQGRGLGRSLLQDAMLRADEAAEELGIRVMLVHAKHERARRWYE